MTGRGLSPTGDPSAKGSSAGQGLERDTLADLPEALLPTRVDPEIASSRPAPLDRQGLTAGTALGRYVLLDVLGAGGMGEVFSAYDPELDRRVAVKVMHAADTAEATAERSRRLMREAQAMARLTHPNVITVHDVGTVGDRMFLAMEFVHGESLRQWLDRESHDWKEVVGLFRGAARGLAAAHAAGLVHRDFKPANVLLARDGRVLVADFGLARAAAPPAAAPDDVQAEGEREPGPGSEVAKSTSPHAARPTFERRVTSPDMPGRGTDSALETPMTRTGALMGTPAYMAPEQHLGEPTDARSDQFSLCVALFEALYGARPFRGDTVAALSFAVLTGKTVEPRASQDVPGWLDAAVRRGLSTSPDDRFPTMEAFLEALAGPRRSTWQRPAMLVGALALAAAAAAGFALRPDDGPAPCQGAARQLEGVWDEARRDAVREAFEASSRAYVGLTLERVTARLDDYAGAWTAAHRDACAATRIRGDQSEARLDLRMACLSRRRASLGALVETLAQADDAILERAIASTHALPAVADCSNPDARTGNATRPATIREAIEAQHRVLARAQSLAQLGQHDAAAQEVASVFEVLEPLADDDLHARALLLRANINRRQGKRTDAARDARQGLFVATAAGLADLEAKAASVLILEAGADTQDFDAGHDFDRHAEAVLRRIGDPPDGVAVRLKQLGSLLYAEGRYDEALQAKRDALALREPLLEPGDPRIADLRANIAVVLNAVGRTEEAERVHRAVIEARDATLGPDHPDTAMAHNNLGNVLLSSGRVEEATHAFVTALDVWTRSLAPGHPKLAMAHNNLGNVAGTLGDAAAATEHYLQAIEIWGGGGDTHDLRVGYALSNLGRVLVAAGRAEEALAHERKALRIHEAKLGPDHADNAYVHLNLAWALHELGRFEESLSHARLAHDISKAALGPEHSMMMGAWLSIGQAQLGLGQADEAMQSLAKAWSIADNPRIRAAEKGDIRLAMARASLARGDRDGAKELAEEARDHYGADEVSHPTRIADVDALIRDASAQ